MRMRLLRSFRLRIAVLSTIFSAVVFGGFATYALKVIQRVSIESLDAELSDLTRRSLGRGRDRTWNEIYEGMVQAYVIVGHAKPRHSLPDGDHDDMRADQLTMLVLGPGREVLFEAPTWPKGIALDEFPDPDDQARPEGDFREEPRPDRMGPPGRGRGFDRRPDHGPDHGPGPAGRRPFPGPGGRPPEPPQIRLVFSHDDGHRLWRVVVMSTPFETVAVGLDQIRSTDDLQRVRTAFLIVLPLGLFLTTLASLVLTQRALRPLTRLADLTERITARGLHERLPLQDEDVEFQRLINVFNGMLDRLARSFLQATRFSADAAHELKTPLAVLQGELERGVQESVPGSEEQGRYSRLLEQITRLKSITRKLLLLATADAGELRLHLSPFDLSEAVEATGEDAAILAPHLRIERRVEPGVIVQADGDLLRQVLQNLLMNAVTYNTPDGMIGLHLREFGEHTQLTITNTGPAIPAADRDRLFERFYRADQARGHASGGTGLGLSLAREIARAHGGDLYLEQTPPGQVAFTLELPRVPQASPGQKSSSVLASGQ